VSHLPLELRGDRLGGLLHGLRIAEIVISDRRQFIGQFTDERNPGRDVEADDVRVNLPQTPWTPPPCPATAQTQG
jgi:hypothetical protein